MKRFLLLIIRIYTKLFRPLASTQGSCRFVPTCSDYAGEAIHKHGVIRGMAKAVWRILRCQPFAKGGLDLP